VWARSTDVRAQLRRVADEVVERTPRGVAVEGAQREGRSDRGEPLEVGPDAVGPAGGQTADHAAHQSSVLRWRPSPRTTNSSWQPTACTPR